MTPPPIATTRSSKNPTLTQKFDLISLFSTIDVAPIAAIPAAILPHQSQSLTAAQAFSFLSPACSPYARLARRVIDGGTVDRAFFINAIKLWRVPTRGRALGQAPRSRKASPPIRVTIPHASRDCHRTRLVRSTPLAQGLRAASRCCRRV